MSDKNPTPDELKYLAGLDCVRSDGIDETSPALARQVLKLQAIVARLRKAVADAMSILADVDIKGDDAANSAYIALVNAEPPNAPVHGAGKESPDVS